MNPSPYRRYAPPLALFAPSPSITANSSTAENMTGVMHGLIPPTYKQKNRYTFLMIIEDL